MVPIRERRGQHAWLIPHPTIRRRATESTVKTHHQRRGTVGIDCLALRDCHRPESAPVVRTLHRDDVLLARNPTRHLERSLDRLGTRICEKE